LSKPLMTPLHVAAQNSTDVVRFLLSSGNVNVNAVEVNGLTPLHIAKSRAIAELLVENGSHIGAVSHHGYNALQTAIMNNSHEVLVYLLPRYREWLSGHANVLALWRGVARSDNRQIFQCLQDAGLELEQIERKDLIPLLAESAANGADCALSALLQHVISKSLLSDLQLAFHILMIAVNKGCLESTRTLSAIYGIHAFDLDGWQPLLLACRAGSLELVETLLESGADVRACDPETNKSCTEVAKEAENSEDIVQSLNLYLSSEWSGYKGKGPA